MEKLFSEFFIEAESRLLPDAKIAILFSNIAQITNSTDQHPIEQELLTWWSIQTSKPFKRTVKDASEKTTRNQHLEGNRRGRALDFRIAIVRSILIDFE